MRAYFSRRRFLGATLYGALSACTGGNGSLFQPLPQRQLEHALAQLDSMAAAIMARTQVPGMALALVRRRADGVVETLHAKGYGQRAVDDPAAVDADTVFQLASLSKSLGASVVAHQVGAGRTHWNTPVRQHLPWFTLSDPDAGGKVTIGDLYSHSSGLPGMAGNIQEAIGFDQDYILQRLRDLPLAPIGSRYAYSNFGMTAAGVAVAQAAGLDWASLCERDLYQPLGMTRTSSRYADFATRGNRALGHIRRNGAWVRCEVRQPDAQAPAGGVSSSLNDLTHWMGMMLGEGEHEGRRIIDRAALRAALVPRIESQSAADFGGLSHYGYGFVIAHSGAGRLIYRHSGAFELGISTHFVLVPEIGIGFAILLNAFLIGTPEAFGLELLDVLEFGRAQQDWWTPINAIYAAFTGPIGSLAGQPAPAQPQAPRALADYAGVYRNPHYGPLQIGVEGGQLVLTVGPRAQPMALTHWDGDRFVWEPDQDDQNPGSRYLVEFVGAQVKFEYLEDDGMGIFTRDP